MKIKQSKKQQAELNRLKAISHPLRAEILLILGEKTASPVQISKQIGGDVREISRQCRILEKLECAELVSTRPRRGATEHFYKATEFHLIENDEWDSLHPVEKDHFLGDIVKAIGRDIDRSHRAGMLGSDPSKEELMRTPRVFDQEGQARALEIVKQADEALTDIAEESADRIAASGEEGIAYSSFFGLFEVPLT